MRSRRGTISRRCVDGYRRGTVGDDDAWEAQHGRVFGYGRPPVLSDRGGYIVRVGYITVGGLNSEKLELVLDRGTDTKARWKLDAGMASIRVRIVQECGDRNLIANLFDVLSSNCTSGASVNVNAPEEDSYG